MTGAGAHGEGSPNLQTIAAELFPSPTAALAAGGQTSRSGDRKGELLLAGIAESLLPTPTVADAEASGGSLPSAVTLTDAVVRTELGQVPNPRHALLPTPMTTDAKNVGPADANRESVQLRAIEYLLPTPIASEGSKGNALSPEHRRAGGYNVWLSHVAPTLTGDDDELLPTPISSLNADPAAFAERSQASAERHGNGGIGLPLGVAVRVPNWGKYTAAIRRAEAVLLRPAPAPTKPDGKGNKERLSSRFVEFMMMLRDGHVTGHGLTRTQELARLGNGVVPLQAAAATSTLIGILADDFRENPR